MRELALFAGAGGGILGGRLLGWRTVCAVEFASYPRSVLLARQRDGQLSRFPIWDDVTTFDGKPWRGRVDVVSGGFPCQDISSAGKGAGLDGARSGLWSEMARIVGEVRPRFVFVENSPMLTSRGLGVVLGDLASMGFNAEWGVLGARDAGAPHKRDRIWIVACAHADGIRHERGAESNARGIQEVQGNGSGDLRSDMADAASVFGHVCGHHCGGDIRRAGEVQIICESRDGRDHSWRRLLPGWASEPDVGRVAHGVASRVDRLKAIGNGQVPQCAALAWRVLSERLGAR